MKYFYQALAQNPSVWALAEVSFVWEGFANGSLKVEYILGFLANVYSFLFTLPISEQTERQDNTTLEQLAKGRLWVCRGFKNRPPNPQTPPSNFVLKIFFMLISVTIDDLNQRNAMENRCKAQRYRVLLVQETHLTNCFRIMLDEASWWLLNAWLMAILCHFGSSPLLSILGIGIQVIAT